MSRIEYNLQTGERQEHPDAPSTYAPPTPVQLRSGLIVSPRQIRQALTAVGVRQAVEAAVAAGDQNLKDWWEFATAFERLHPQVIAMGQTLGQTDAQLDALFALALTL